MGLAGLIVRVIRVRSSPIPADSRKAAVARQSTDSSAPLLRDLGTFSISAQKAVAPPGTLYPRLCARCAFLNSVRNRFARSCARPTEARAKASYDQAVSAPNVS